MTKKGFARIQKESQERAFKLGEGLPGHVWSTGTAQWVDLKSISQEKFPRKNAALASGLRHGLGFPIMGQNKLLGVIEFFSDKIDGRDVDHLYTLSAFGQEIGQFVESVQAKEELVERAELSTFVAETAYVLSQQTKLEEMLKQCTSLMTRHLNAKIARVWAISEDDKQRLILMASSGQASSADSGQKFIKVGEGEIGMVAEQLRPFLTNDLDTTASSTSKGWVEAGWADSSGGLSAGVRKKNFWAFLLCTVKRTFQTIAGVPLRYF